MPLNRFLIRLFFFITIVFLAKNASGFNATIIPSKINPGDAFLIKISGFKDQYQPVVSFKDKQLSLSRQSDGSFIAIGAADIDTKPGYHPVTITAGTKKIKKNLIVKKISFPSINLSLPEEKVTLSPEDLERAEKEAALLKSFWPILSDKQWEGRFTSPLQNEISTQFGIKRIINKKKTSIHYGIDIKGKNGELVRASNAGRVILAEELFFGGNTLILDHGQGIYTIYMHLSKMNVKTEDLVSKNDVIGHVGSSGRSSGPHLHFGVKVHGINVNPVSFFNLEL